MLRQAHPGGERLLKTFKAHSLTYKWYLFLVALGDKMLELVISASPVTPDEETDSGFGQKITVLKIRHLVYSPRHRRRLRDMIIRRLHNGVSHATNSGASIEESVKESKLWQSLSSG